MLFYHYTKLTYPIQLLLVIAVISKWLIKTKGNNASTCITYALTLVKEIPKGDDYIFELKWDGYRIVSVCNDGKIRLNSRSGLDYTAKYPNIAKALKSLKRNVTLDGKVVVFNQEGKPDFDLFYVG